MGKRYLADKLLEELNGLNVKHSPQPLLHSGRSKNASFLPWPEPPRATTGWGLVGCVLATPCMTETDSRPTTGAQGLCTPQASLCTYPTKLSRGEGWAFVWTRVKLREGVQQPQGALTSAFSFNIQNSHKLCILLMSINVFVLNTNVFLSKSSSKRGIPAFWYSLKQNPFYLGTKPTLLGLPKAVWTCRRQLYKGTDTSYYISATTLRSELNAPS